MTSVTTRGLQHICRQRQQSSENHGSRVSRPTMLNRNKNHSSGRTATVPAQCIYRTSFPAKLTARYLTKTTKSTDVFIYFQVRTNRTENFAVLRLVTIPENRHRQYFPHTACAVDCLSLAFGSASSGWRRCPRVTAASSCCTSQTCTYRSFS